MRPWLLAVFALLAAPVAAQTPPNVPSAQPAPERVYFPQMLERLAAGKPVPLVAVSLGDAMGRPQSPPNLIGKTFKEALGIIGDAYSDHLEAKAPPTKVARWEENHETLVPYEFAHVWTIARDHQWEFAKTPDIPEVLSATSTMVLLPRLVNSLSDEQVRKATTSGLSFGDFTRRQQPVFRAAFQRPMTLFTTQIPATRDRPPSQTVNFDGVLPIEQCTVHLNLAFSDFILVPPGTKAGEPVYSWPMDQYGPTTSFPDFPTAPNGYTFPLLNRVPAKLKTGDLAFDTPALNAPIGVSGIVRLDKAVEAAAKATGLALRVDPRFAGYNVAFIGDKALRTGDVLRAFAFDVQGAWRRVSDTYILTFDREPLAATRMVWEEQIGVLDKDRDSLLETQLGHREDDDGEHLLRLLQSDPDGPPGPTAEQVAQMLVTETQPQDRPPREYQMTFAGLTPDQQDAVKQRMRANYVDKYRPDVESPGIQAMLPQATMDELNVRMTIDIPKLGSYKVQGYYATVSPRTLAFRKWLKPQRSADKAAEPDNPVTLSAKTRALAVAPLARAEWPRLIDQMRRKGLDTLYLPVLWDGYTVYPSKQFPQLPIARQRDMLAEILSLAGKEKIKVVALLHTLAWRHPGGSELHWLRKTPELVDRDVKGQGRRDWTMAHLTYLLDHKDYEYGHLLYQDPFLFSDMARPSDPAVKQRLIGVLDELKGYKGLTGVAFAEWSRISYQHYLSQGPALDVGGPPILGFAVPQRAVFIKEHSIDPGDFETQGATCIQVPTFALREDQRDLDNAWAKVRLTEDTDLLKTLKAAAEKTWPGRIHVISALESSDKGELQSIPTGDVNVRGGFMARYSDNGAWVPFAPDPDLLGDTPDPEDGKAPDRVTELATQLVQRAAFQAGAKRPPLPGIVLDFRAAPSLLWDGLARLANAPSPGTGQ